VTVSLVAEDKSKQDQERKPSMTPRKLAWLIPAALAFVLAAGCGDDEKKFEASQYAGTYSGSWTNPAGGTGSAVVAITIDEKAHTANLTLDFGGNYLGLGDPPPATIQGVFDDKQATVKGKNELLGDYDVTIDADGKITGVFQNMAGGLVPKMTYTGTLTKSKLEADYLVTFKDGSTATSELRTAKK
jgi:hypothetical protein